MKTIAVASLLILAASSGSAQTLPLPDSAAVWVNTLYTVEPFPPPVTYILQTVDSYCTHGDDTLINNTGYVKLEYCGGGYKGAFRNDQGRVRYVPADSTEEYLLYDFTLTDGDTAFNVYFEFPYSGGPTLTDVVIANVMYDPLLEGRKVLYLQAGGEWIEGIGAAWGLFSEPWVNVSNWQRRLECMALRDSTHYPADNIGAGVCELNVHVAEVMPPSGISIYPNPTSDGVVRLHVPDAGWVRSATVTTPDGRVISTQLATTGADATLDMGNAPPCLYLIHLQAGERRVVRMVVRQ